jgi:hypothetical protein
MFQILVQLVQKIKTHTLCSVDFFRKSSCLWDNAQIFGGGWEAINDNTTRRMRVASWISEATRAHAHAHAPGTPHISTHASTLALVRSRAHKHTQKYVILITFPLQQRFRERASMFRYAYIACLIVHVTVTKSPALTLSSPWRQPDLRYKKMLLNTDKEYFFPWPSAFP